MTIYYREESQKIPGAVFLGEDCVAVSSIRETPAQMWKNLSKKSVDELAQIYSSIGHIPEKERSYLDPNPGIVFD